MATLILKYELAVLKDFPIQKSSITVGRSRGNEIVIDDLTVSASHLRVSLQQGTFIVEDLSSRNGTFLNGRRIHKSTLKEGDQISVGKHTLQYTEEGGISMAMLLPAGESRETTRMDTTVALDTKHREDVPARAPAKTYRTEKIKVGSLLIKGKDQLPLNCWVESDQYNSDWILIRKPSWNEVGQQILKAGWQIVLVRGDFTASAQGFSAERGVHSAMKKLIETPSEPFNCLQIEQVGIKRFLGLVFVEISAQRREIRDPFPQRGAKIMN